MNKSIDNPQQHKANTSQHQATQNTTEQHTIQQYVNIADNKTTQKNKNRRTNYTKPVTADNDIEHNKTTSTKKKTNKCKQTINE